jgi:hypothetical protein
MRLRTPLLLSLCYFLFVSASAESLSFKEKILRGTPGHFIVTQESKNQSLLFIRDLSPSTLYLEEITFPEERSPLPGCSWHTWLRQKAPGHTSWVLYVIDLEKERIKEEYSFSKKSWLSTGESSSFLAKLLSLPLSQVSSTERKRIGPPPLRGESDRRSAWTPPLFIEGKRVEKPLFEVFRTQWPHDETPLSRCHIELYFDAKHPSFPLPHWIEIKSAHYALTIRTIDSGTGISSPFLLPKLRSLPQ